MIAIMVAAYLCVLLASVGIFLVQLTYGADHHDGSYDGHGTSSWSLLVSVRFWSFGMLAFGLVGTALTLLELTSPILTGVLASIMGTVSGIATSALLRWLRKSSPSSHATATDVVGRVGRVLVPIDPGAHGKVRVEIKESAQDFIASASEAIREGESVVIEEEGGDGTVIVSRAPSEIA
jgi:membrane protein implicated in regulation of membrane protease activity